MELAHWSLKQKKQEKPTRVADSAASRFISLATKTTKLGPKRQTTKKQNRTLVRNNNLEEKALANSSKNSA